MPYNRRSIWLLPFYDRRTYTLIFHAEEKTYETFLNELEAELKANEKDSTMSYCLVIDSERLREYREARRDRDGCYIDFARLGRDFVLSEMIEECEAFVIKEYFRGFPVLDHNENLDGEHSLRISRGTPVHPNFLSLLTSPSQDQSSQCCGICLESMENTPSVLLPKCKHVFHLGRGLSWNRRQPWL